MEQIVSELYTVKEAAGRLRVSERLVARLIAGRKLASVKIAGRRLIDSRDLDAFIASHRTEVRR